MGVQFWSNERPLPQKLFPHNPLHYTHLLGVWGVDRREVGSRGVALLQLPAPCRGLPESRRATTRGRLERGALRLQRSHLAAQVVQQLRGGVSAQRGARGVARRLQPEGAAREAGSTGTESRVASRGNSKSITPTTSRAKD